MKLRNTPFPLYFEEGDKEADPKTFTQEQVNTMLASNKKNLQAEVTKKTEALVTAQADVSLSQEQKDALQVRVEELEALTLTEKELSARDKKKVKAEYDSALGTSKEEATKWKALHNSMMIETAITQASLVEGQKAITPSQLVALFARDATVVEKDGAFSVQIGVTTKGEDGQIKTLALDPVAAVKEYASRAEYFNLFEDPSKDGLGRKRQAHQPGTIPTSMSDYKANRKEILK